MDDGENHLTDDRPAGFIEVSDNLMPYWTRDGRSIEEIWEEQHARTDSDDVPF